MRKEIYSVYADRLQAAAISNVSPITGLTYQLAYYAEPGKYEMLSETLPLETGKPFFAPKKANTVFVKGTVTFPAEIRQDEEYEDCLLLRFHNLGGTIYVDGEPYSGIDEFRDRIYLRKEWAGQTKEFLIEGYFLLGKYGSNNDFRTGILEYAQFVRADKVIEKYKIDLDLFYDAYEYDCQNPQEDNMAICRKMEKAAELSIQYLDLNLTGDALREAVRRADEMLLEKLDEIDDGDTRACMSLIASTHIDVAWLWQFKDTVRKCGHSFSNMLRLLDRYPNFKFSNSQVQLMAFTKEYYPDLFAQIKEMEKAGRWENVGSMWVESDCNVISGESMTRQYLYGATFLDREFGHHSRVGWLPDAFGFQASMPQILKKSGLDYFYSYKLHWQAAEEFPYGDFRWKGIDGSEVIAATINNHCSGYNGDPCPKDFRETKADFKQIGEVNEILYPYGYGDGGGGPNSREVEYAERMKDYPGLPKSEITTAQGFFDKLEAIKEDLPTWFGELYIQTHRGTLTSQAFAKKENRHFEMLYSALEKLGVMAETYGAKPDWELLHKGWEKGLLLQFHDVLPGSSISPVYEDVRNIYGEIFDIAKRFLDSAGLNTCVDIQKGLRVVNTLSWDRDILVNFRCPFADVKDGIQIVADGANMPCSVVRDGEDACVTFLAKQVTALGCREFTVLQKKPDARRTMDVTQTEAGIRCENARYVAVIDGCGRLTQLLDKQAGKQVLSQPGNHIKVFLDGPQLEDAWNLNESYMQREISIFNSAQTEITENGDLRTVIHVHQTGDKVDLHQDIIFYHDNARIDFVTSVDWQERNKVMRVYFPAALHAPYYTSEVGFGAFDRPSVPNSKLEQAKFEVAAHRWIDISENNYGVALLNDCKYGHSVQYNVIGMTMLRGTTWPAEDADLGMHHFTYSLLPHSGHWSQAGVARAGQELNAQTHVPCLVNGMLATNLFVCDNANVIIDTIKPAENKDGIVVRLYEANGSSGTAVITSKREIASVTEINLVEEAIASVECGKNTISYAFTPYEIKTFLVKF